MAQHCHCLHNLNLCCMTRVYVTINSPYDGTVSNVQPCLAQSSNIASLELRLTILRVFLECVWHSILSKFWFTFLRQNGVLHIPVQYNKPTVKERMSIYLNILFDSDYNETIEQYLNCGLLHNNYTLVNNIANKFIVRSVTSLQLIQILQQLLCYVGDYIIPPF